MNILGICALGLAALGCAAEPANDGGNEQLGIARFEITESADKTVVVGFDENRAEIGRLELVHGQFNVSPMFADDYATSQIDGRKLDVDVLGQQLRWETAGYAPTLQLPPHPPSQVELAQFVADPHVKAVLDRWQIGFQKFVTADEAAFGAGGEYRGTDAQTCAGATCGTVGSNSIGTCGGGIAAISAKRITQTYGTNCGVYTSSYNQIVVEQCCPSGSGGQTSNWFGIKSCSTLGPTSMCGTTTTGTCKGCPGYPATYSTSCTVGVTPYVVGTCNGSSIVGLYYSWN